MEINLVTRRNICLTKNFYSLVWVHSTLTIISLVDPTYHLLENRRPIKQFELNSRTLEVYLRALVSKILRNKIPELITNLLSSLINLFKRANSNRLSSLINLFKRANSKCLSSLINLFKRANSNLLSSKIKINNLLGFHLTLQHWNYREHLQITNLFKSDNN